MVKRGVIVAAGFVVATDVAGPERAAFGDVRDAVFLPTKYGDDALLSSRARPNFGRGFGTGTRSTCAHFDDWRARNSNFFGAASIFSDGAYFSPSSRLAAAQSGSQAHRFLSRSALLSGENLTRREGGEPL